MWFAYISINFYKNFKMGFFQIAFDFLLKILAYKKGASALLSFVVSISLSASLSNYIALFIEGADKKVMIMPLIIEIIMFIIFFMLNLLDLRYGAKVAIVIKKEKFDWGRIWDTFAKMFGIVFITAMLMVFSMVFESLDSRYLWWASFTPLCFLWILAIGFEFGSLGRHIKELRGSKPDIFLFFDKVLDSLQKKAIEKIDNSFNILDNEKDNTTGSNSTTE